MTPTDRIESLALPGGRRAVFKPADAWQDGHLALWLNRLRSPGLPRCFGISSPDSRPGFRDLPPVFLESPPQEAQILVEYLEGISLREIPQEDLTSKRLRAWFDQILEALAWIMLGSGLPFVHLDISPENIIITPHGRAALIDFSGGRLLDGSQPASDLTLSGKRGYAAPEVYQGRISPAADLYSLAMSFLSVLAGKPASALDPQSQDRLLRDLGQPLEALLTLCLDEDADKRRDAAAGSLYQEALALVASAGARSGGPPCPYALSDCPFLALARRLAGPPPGSAGRPIDSACMLQ